MAYAAASDVTVRWAREPSDQEIALINVRLEDVERMIRRRIPDLDDRVDVTVSTEDVVQIEADAVLRLVRNPEGYLSESDGNYTYMLQNDLATGRLEILPDEWETLGLANSGLFILAPNAVRAT
jgi:hypothetical protein